MQTNEAIGMAARRIVMRPMYDRQPARIVDHFSANLHAIPDLYRAPRRNRYVVDDFERAGAGLSVEGFVHAARSRTKEVARWRRDGRFEIDPGGSSSGVRTG
jgi:hypothetical protein